MVKLHDHILFLYFLKLSQAYIFLIIPGYIIFCLWHHKSYLIHYLDVMQGNMFSQA